MWDKAAKGFKFKIGDVVMHRATGQRMTVLSRLVLESTAGLRLIYFCGWTDRSLRGVYEFFAEELDADPVGTWTTEKMKVSPTTSMQWTVTENKPTKRRK